MSVAPGVQHIQQGDERLRQHGGDGGSGYAHNGKGTDAENKHRVKYNIEHKPRRRDKEGGAAVAGDSNKACENLV